MTSNDRPDSDPDSPSPLLRFDDFVAALGGRRPAVFLDYDGTLTPIVDRPERAVLDPAVREGVARLAARCPVAIVSGRDRADVERLVALPALVYAGSHGFDIKGPDLRSEVGTGHLPALDRAEAALRARLGGVPGALVERKRFAIAVHTRLVDPAAKPAVAEAVRQVAAGEAGLRTTGGKEIHELRPDLPWNKGMAVLALLDRLGLAGDDAIPVYLGDDETDEDAFRALASRTDGPAGLGIRVTDRPVPTAAAWRLADPGEVAAFLDRLASRLDG